MRIRRLPPPPGAGAGRGGEGGGRAGGGGPGGGGRTLILIRRLPPECGFGKTEQAGLALARQRRGDTKPAHPSPEGRAGGASPAGRGRRARGSGLPPPAATVPFPVEFLGGCKGFSGLRGTWGLAWDFRGHAGFRGCVGCSGPPKQAGGSPGLHRSGPCLPKRTPGAALACAAHAAAHTGKCTSQTGKSSHTHALVTGVGADTSVCNRKQQEGSSAHGCQPGATLPTAPASPWCIVPGDNETVKEGATAALAVPAATALQ